MMIVSRYQTEHVAFFALTVSLLFININLSNAQGLDSRHPNKLCLGQCHLHSLTNQKICSFDIQVNYHSSELGYFTVNGCQDHGPMPTLGIEKNVTYYFRQEHETNYNHPLGFAYYPDGEHDDKDELEPEVRKKPTIPCFCISFMSFQCECFVPCTLFDAET